MDKPKTTTGYTGPPSPLAYTGCTCGVQLKPGEVGTMGCLNGPPHPGVSN